MGVMAEGIGKFNPPRGEREMKSGELKAWLWLLDLPRLDYKEESTDQQIIIRVCPGKLHETSGAPLVHVSCKHPKLAKRIRGSGNSLCHAVGVMQSKLWRQGIKTPITFNYF